MKLEVTFGVFLTVLSASFAQGRILYERTTRIVPGGRTQIFQIPQDLYSSLLFGFLAGRNSGTNFYDAGSGIKNMNAASGRVPTWVAGSGYSFDGTSDGLFGGDNMIPIGSTFTVLASVKPTSTTLQDCVFFEYGGVGQDYWRLSLYDGRPTLAMRDASGDSLGVLGSTACSTSTWSIVTWERRSAGVGATRINGTVVGVATNAAVGAINLVGYRPGYLGMDDTGTAFAYQNWFPGLVGEVLYFNKLLSDDEHSRVLAVMKRRYGIP